MPTVTTKDHTAQDPLARAKMFAWMFINTLATVFIVSRCSFSRARIVQECQLATWSLFCPRSLLPQQTLTPHVSTGLLQQSHLFRSLLFTMSGRFCLLSLFCHSRDPLHSLPAHIQHVRSETPPRLQHDPTGNFHGHEHCRHESVLANLNNHFLPNHSSAAHSHRCRHQLLHLQKVNPPTRGILPHPHVLWRRTHFVLRCKTTATTRIAHQEHRLAQYPRGLWLRRHIRRLHGVGRHLPAKVRSQRLPTLI